MPAYAPIVDDVLMKARAEAGGNASDKTWPARVQVARRRLRLQDPRDCSRPRLHRGRRAPLLRHRRNHGQARDIIRSTRRPASPASASSSRFASTWEGIKAAEILEKEGIHCNLTLLFGLHQAIACAEAKVTLISPFVGRILDWYKKDTGKDYSAADDPGVQSVTTIYNYYKHFGYKTVVMGASFRNIGEITELAGCDLLTIAPKLLAELESKQGDLPRKLDASKAAAMDIQKIPMDKATFDKMHAADRMASDKLSEGIEGFSKALEELEQLLAKRLSEISEKQAVGTH